MDKLYMKDGTVLIGQVQQGGPKHLILHREGESVAIHRRLVEAVEMA